MKKTYQYLSVIVSSMLLLGACGDKQSPGLEYMPDMYRTPAVVAYSPSHITKDSVSALAPVAGTVARGQYVDFIYPNTNEGYEAAGLELKNPFQPTAENMERGKTEFDTYCAHCHGEKGDGKGWLKIKGDPFPVPSYTSAAIKDLPDGKMFFSITYGKNLMGSHAAQVSADDRWKIILYINHLQGDEPGTVVADSSATAQNK